MPSYLPHIFCSRVHFTRWNIQPMQTIPTVVQSTFWINYNNVISTANLYQNYYKSHSSRPIHIQIQDQLESGRYMRFTITCIVCVPYTWYTICTCFCLYIMCRLHAVAVYTNNALHRTSIKHACPARRWKQNSEKIYPNARTLGINEKLIQFKFVCFEMSSNIYKYLNWTHVVSTFNWILIIWAIFIQFVYLLAWNLRAAKSISPHWNIYVASRSGRPGAHVHWDKQAASEWLSRAHKLHKSCGSYGGFYGWMCWNFLFIILDVILNIFEEKAREVKHRVEVFGI